jgi:hypothetical protein
MQIGFHVGWIEAFVRQARGAGGWLGHHDISFTKRHLFEIESTKQSAPRVRLEQLALDGQMERAQMLQPVLRSTS